jgi:hypothetical protein
MRELHMNFTCLRVNLAAATAVGHADATSEQLSGIHSSWQCAACLTYSFYISLHM